MKSAPPQPAAPRIQVFTLRPFQILVNGEPLTFPRRAQRKPLGLLKTLLALGGEGVTEQALTDALWPDADGAAAHSNFAATLHRLRKLLGPDLLTLRNGKLSLDPSRYWADCRDFSAAMADVQRSTREDQLEPAFARIAEALALYVCPFLDGESDPPEIGVMREKLQSLLVLRVTGLARLLEQRGQRERAATLCLKGLDADPLAEDIHRVLIRCYQTQGRRAEALAAYARCRELLRQQWGIEPSAETQALCSELTAPLAAPQPQRGGAPAAAQPAARPQPSIAVLPLDNLSGDPAQEYFSDGFTEDLITQLARIPGLRVMSRHSSFAFKGASKDARVIGRELGAGFLLEGSIRRSAERIRVTAQLIDAPQGAHLWAETFDRQASGLFEVQDNIIGEIAGRLVAEIERGAIDRSRRKPPGDLQAYELVLQTWPLLYEVDEPSYSRARELLERALSLDPDFVPALTQLSAVFLAYYRFQWSGASGLLERGFELARRAVDLDPLDARARVSLAQAHFFRGELSPFETQAFRALELNPHDSWAWFYLAYLNICLGRSKEALRLNENAMRLDPGHSAHFYWVPMLDHYLGGRYDEALGCQLRVDAPRFHIFHAWLAVIYGQLGRLAEARAEASETLRIHPGFDIESHYRRYNMPEANIRKVLDGARKAGLA